MHVVNFPFLLVSSYLAKLTPHAGFLLSIAAVTPTLEAGHCLTAAESHSVTLEGWTCHKRRARGLQLAILGTQEYCPQKEERRLGDLTEQLSSQHASLSLGSEVPERRESSRLFTPFSPIVHRSDQVMLFFLSLVQSSRSQYGYAKLDSIPKTSRAPRASVVT